HKSSRLDERRRLRPELLAERPAFNELRDDETRAVGGAADIVDRDDIGVVELGGRAGFGEVKFGGLRPGNELGVRDLACPQALQLLVEDQVDPTEPTPTEQGLDAIAAYVRGNPSKRFGSGNRHAQFERRGSAGFG